MQDFLSYENNNAWLYLLRNKESNEPISFALYSKEDDKEAVHLEMIYTHCERNGSGFGEVLLTQSFKDLQKKGLNMVTSTVEYKNKAIKLLCEIGELDKKQEEEKYNQMNKNYKINRFYLEDYLLIAVYAEKN